MENCAHQVEHHKKLRVLPRTNNTQNQWLEYKITIFKVNQTLIPNDVGLNWFLLRFMNMVKVA